MQPIVALGCGLVGEFVIHRLADEGHAVTAVDLRIPSSLKQRPDVFSIEQDALQYVDAVIGNSSSGIVEAPSFKTASIKVNSESQKVDGLRTDRIETGSFTRTIKELGGKGSNSST